MAKNDTNSAWRKRTDKGWQKVKSGSALPSFLSPIKCVNVRCLFRCSANSRHSPHRARIFTFAPPRATLFLGLHRWSSGREIENGKIVRHCRRGLSVYSKMTCFFVVYGGKCLNSVLFKLSLSYLVSQADRYRTIRNFKVCIESHLVKIFNIANI